MEGFERHTGIGVDDVVVFGRVLPTGAVETSPRKESPDFIASELSRFASSLNASYVRVKTSPLGI